MSTLALASNRRAPGPRGRLPLPGTDVGRLRSDPLGFLLDGARTYGDVWRFHIGPIRFYVIGHPEGVKRVLLDNAKNYPRSWYYKRASIGAGQGLVTTEGAPWRRLRRMVQPAFHPQKLAAFASVMVETTAAFCQRWEGFAQSGQVIDVAEEFMRLTLQIAGRTLVSLDLAGEADRIGQAVTDSLVFLEHWLSNLLALPPWIPTRRNRKFVRAIQTLDEAIYGIIARRRSASSADAPNDLLAMLLAVRDEEAGGGLSDKEVRDQLLTMIVAGHETTAVALAWAAYLVSRHAEVAGLLRSEVDQVLSGRQPELADLPRLAYVRQVIEETLRLYPPVYGVARSARAADEIGGFRIPAKSMIILSPYVTQHHPGVWPDPERFDPDRFRPEQSSGRPRFAWYPFLGGPHQCIGQDFAMMEATIVVAMLAQRFRLELVGREVVEPLPMLSLRPKGGVPMRVRRA